MKKPPTEQTSLANLTTKAKTYYKPPPPKLIKTQKNLSTLGILLLNQPTFQAIRSKSGPLANNCEYQTHFWALVLRVTNRDNSIIDICIPTVFFNYKQEVTGTRIDFELTDVNEMSEKLEPVHNMKVNEFLASPFMEYLQTMFTESDTELISVATNSIHRHPGSSNKQSFSSTDLNTSHLYNTGIVFPLASATSKPNFAGIMAHDGPVNNVAHFEYRVADGAINTKTKSTITYTKSRCISYIAAGSTTPSDAEQFIGIVPKSASYSTLDDVPASYNNSTLLDIFTEWEADPLLPSTDFVIPANVTRRISKTPTHYASKPSDNSLLASTCDEEMYKIGTSIKWYDTTTINTMSLSQLVTATEDLSIFYYGAKVGKLEQSLRTNKIECSKEYNYLRVSIINELKDMKKELDQEREFNLLYQDINDYDIPDDVFDEEHTFMVNKLIGNGTSVEVANKLSPLEVLQQYTKEFVEWE